MVEDEPKATQRGNLPRAFVRRIFDELECEIDPFVVEGSRNRQLNEGEVPDLLFVRVLTGLAGLWRRRRGRFVATARGKALLAEEASGELWEVLVRASLRRYEGDSDRLPDLPLLRDGAGLLLYKLGAEGREWRMPGELAELVLPESVLRNDALLLDESIASWAFRLRVVPTLLGLGLLEREVGPPAAVSPGDMGSIEAYLSYVRSRVRVSPLWDRALVWRL